LPTITFGAHVVAGVLADHEIRDGNVLIGQKLRNIERAGLRAVVQSEGNLSGFEA
jgi:hypothetical protein